MVHADAHVPRQHGREHQAHQQGRDEASAVKKAQKSQPPNHPATQPTQRPANQPNQAKPSQVTASQPSNQPTSRSGSNLGIPLQRAGSPLTHGHAEIKLHVLGHGSKPRLPPQWTSQSSLKHLLKWVVHSPTPKWDPKTVLTTTATMYCKRLPGGGGGGGPVFQARLCGKEKPSKAPLEARRAWAAFSGGKGPQLIDQRNAVAQTNHVSCRLWLVFREPSEILLTHLKQVLASCWLNGQNWFGTQQPVPNLT